MKKSRLWPITVILILSACTAKTATVTPSETHTQSISATPAPIEVVHTARYTLVSLTPDETLTFPLRQVTSHALPAPKKNRPTATRGDALRAWLSGTGYGLCLPVTRDTRQLFASPLPDIQRSMGPMRIDDALRVIAGEAWVMNTDEVTRTVCFQRAPTDRLMS
ncbi:MULTISPECIES: response regulator [Pectobacteriaceae]|uniref:Response regulator n=1 Tax=Affinibrenneria salicis TaxID=2590031 RepID=A0A5J5FST5_9GAMM|nr:MULTISPECIES: response regulator [Pectobacteriaceae]MEE3644391.1 response regulator [Brenneria sp. L3_3C_1]MEE3651954.1 response regulator [Brenneria sp. HEZEL_4_2_4]MEE3663699.1 response regulator [Brenneria sp. g21c3]KAA8995842.1 response regulator [Affinibrenneria salicis]MBJ7223149.1 response regulator [Brenneria sp. L3-3C-1]